MARWSEACALLLLAMCGIGYVSRTAGATRHLEDLEATFALEQRLVVEAALAKARLSLEVEATKQQLEKAELDKVLQQRRAPARRPDAPTADRADEAAPPPRASAAPPPPRLSAPPPPAAALPPPAAASPPPAAAAAKPIVAATPTAPAPARLAASTSPHLVDFPCALRELRKAQVTTTCEISCRDAQCGRATTLCARYPECDAVEVRQGSTGSWIALDAAPKGELMSYSARLLRDTAKKLSEDASVAALQSSKWWRETLRAPQEPYVSPPPKARTYIVVSYGGCGSKMLAGWLSNLERAGGTAKHVKHVYHFHDNKPPDLLREIPPPPPATTQKDYRARRFPGGGRFRTETAVVPPAKLDEYRVLYIFKDPVEALVSRYGHGHCMHLQGNCGEEKSFPKLDRYAAEGVDKMGLEAFFQGYTSPSQTRQFPIVLLNYHKLWDNADAVMDALGLPRSLGGTFPARTETVRNDLTGAAERNAAHTEKTRGGLDKLYAPIVAKIRQLPAVSLS